MAVAAEELHVKCQRRELPRFEDKGNVSTLSGLSTVPEEILEKLNSQRHNSSLCDVTIVTGDGGSFPAHKRVLSSCSRYLEKELSSLETGNTNTEEAVLHLGMVSSRSCEMLLELLYTSKLSLTKENVADILLAAEVLDLHQVSAICRQFLRCGVVSKLVTKDSGSPFKFADKEQSSDREINNNTRSPEVAHKVSGVLRSDNFRKSGVPTLERLLSLSEGGSNNEIQPDAKRSSSVPSFPQKLRLVCSTNMPKDVGSPSISDEGVCSGSSQVDLSKSNTDIITENTRMHSNKQSVGYKVKSEVQLLPVSYKDYKFPTVTVGCTDPKFYSHPEQAPHFSSPLLNRKRFTDAFHSSHSTDDVSAGLYGNKMPRLDQPPINKSTYVPQNFSLPGYHSSAPSLWASMYMLQSEAMHQSRLGRIDNDVISQNYRWFLKELQRSKPLVTPQLISCRICGAECTSEWQLLTHLRFHHYIECTPPADPTLREELHFEKVDLTPAPQRHVTLIRPQPQNETLKNYAEDRNNILAYLANNGANSKSRHKCYHCKKEFDSIHLLRKHKSMEHIKRPHRCHLCDAAFPNKAGLSVHVRSHTGERPYQCKICHKAFTQLGHVQRHQKVHTGEKPYQCPICQARVRDKASLHYHLLAHQGVKPFQCDQCDARFTKRSSLVKHKNVHTGSHLYHCSQCKASFREKASLSRHVRSQHKDSNFLTI